MKAISLCIICHGYPLDTIGGVGVLVQYFLDYAPKLGYQIHLITPKQGWHNRIQSTNHPWGIHHQIEIRSWQWQQLWNHSKGIQHLQRLLRDIQPQSIHLHHFSGFPLEWSNILPPNCHSVLTLHDYALPCARGQLYHRDHYSCDGPNPERCSICTESWLPFQSPENRQQLLTMRSNMVQKLLHSIDIVQSPSKDLAHRFHNWYPSLNIQHIDLPIPSKIEAIPWNQRTQDYIFIGTIIPTKGVHLVIQAFSELSDPNKTLTIIGPDGVFPTFQNYPQYCRNLSQQSNIQWLGHLPQEQTLHLLAQHKVLILPSQWPENSPLTIREADHLGLQVICSSNGGSKELLNQPFLLKNSSISQLKNLMIKAMIQPPSSSKSHPSPMQFVQSQLQTIQSH